MSIGETIRNLFGGATSGGNPPQNPNAVQNPNPGTAPQMQVSQANNPGQPLPGTSASPQTANNGVVPNTPAATPAVDPNNPQSLLDGFQKVWETPATDPSKANTSVFANLDPAKVMESAKTVDFTKALTPEMLQKIAGGGQEAVGALLQALNQVGQQSYGHSALTTAQLIEKALEKQRTEMMAAIPGLVQQHAVSEGLRQANPMMNHPALKPLVGALQNQLTVQHPNASSQEIQQHVEQYFANLGKVFAPKQETPKGNSRNAPETYDFSSFLQ